MKQIYSIGYGSREINDFISLLKKYKISTLVDIRTLPASRFRPDYNKKRFAEKLLLENVEYLFWGDTLGGKPKQEALYTNGMVDYDKVARSQSYKEGLMKLIGLANEKALCIMCAELKPDQCHRKHLVGESLILLDFDVFHLDENGEVEIQSKYNKLF